MDAGANDRRDGRRAEPAAEGYEIVGTYPHDPAAFTQGLLWHDGYLYEGTGRRGTSWLRKQSKRARRPPFFAPNDGRGLLSILD